jgi:hypothetical protein
VQKAGKLTEPPASNVLGFTTGAGTENVRAAGRAGLEGGKAAAALRANVPIDQIVDLAKSGLEKIKAERAEAYKAGKVDL